jgi:polyisoprenoid-binding protein YceI
MRRATGSIRIFTFKEGLMSAVAHDLRLQLQGFELTLDGDDVKANFDLKSLVVEGPVQNGVLHAEQYDANKRADVTRAMHEQVLHTDRHPTARFIGTATPTSGGGDEAGSGYHVAGQLELVGSKQPLSFAVRNDQGTYRAEFELTPSRWGISQYKALFGAIKLKDVFRVELSLSEA